jgi:electron transfer flavoprotein alpha/beta subunit
VSFVRAVSIDGNEVQATRALDDTDQVVAVSLPAVISIDEEAFPPRRTTLMDAMKAKQKPVHVWEIAENLGLVEADLAALRIGELTGQIGIVVHRKEQLLAGEGMADLADQLIDVLIAEEILKGGAA